MIRRYLIEPLIGFLRQGMTPHKLALTIALGFALGVIPILGSTTVLCTIAALALRLNLPAIQAVNGIVYPLQLILLIPFLRAGAWLFGGGEPSLTVQQIFGLIRADVWRAIGALWVATLHAVVVWMVCASIAAVLLYAILIPVLRGLWRRQQTQVD
jgi:uncharacterized protein (DUF2062 family)